MDWKARRLGTVTESTQQTSSLPPPFPHPHPLHSPSVTSATTSTINTINKSKTNTDIDMKSTSTSKSNPTSSSYPNFYTVFGSKSSEPSSVPILKEHSTENINKKSVQSGEVSTNVVINLLNKSNINKKRNDNDSVNKYKTEIENFNKKEGDKSVRDGHIDTKINDYYTTTNTHTHTPTLTHTHTLSSPHKNQRISPIILDNTSLMNILTERSLPKTNTNTNRNTNIENLKICGNIYDSETDDENADECNPVFSTNVHRYSNFDHNISTNVCEISSHMAKIDFSQLGNDIHNSNKNDVKIDQFVDNSSSDNNNNNNDYSTQTRKLKSDGNSLSVSGTDRSISEKESKEKTLCQRQEVNDSNDGVKKEDGGEVEKGNHMKKGEENNSSDKLKTNDIKKTVILCDEKHSNDLMTFSGSNIITASPPIQHNNNENNNNNNIKNRNDNQNENEKLENILFCPTIIESNNLFFPTNSQEKERERDFMNDSNRQLSLPLLPSISEDEDINDKIQALRNEIDFNNNLNARSMRILVEKSVNKIEQMKVNNNDGEICYKTVTDLIEYNTDIESFPCDNFSEESSQLFTLPLIHNLSTFDITSDSDCIALPLSLPSPILPSMTLFNRDQTNTETSNELQKLKRFSIEKFSDINHLEKNESKIFDDDDENDNMVENENGSDNNVERDSGICPFAISSNDQTFPFVDIALSTYNVFDARTHVNNTATENNENDANNQEDEKRSKEGVLYEQDLRQELEKGKNEYSENRLLKIQQREHSVNNNNNMSVSGKEINTIQNDYKNSYKNENEIETSKNICLPNIHVQQYVKNKDENVLEQSSVKVGGDMTRLTSILTAFKTALKLKNVLFSLLLDKEQSQNSLNINIKQRNTSGNIKSINQNSLKLDSNTSTASKSNSILNPETINEKMITHKTENMNMKIDKNNQNNDDDNFISDINTKKIVKELIQFLSSKHMGSSLKFGDSQLATSSLSSFDFVEFFLFFLDIQVINAVFRLIY